MPKRVRKDSVKKFRATGTTWSSDSHRSDLNEDHRTSFEEINPVTIHGIMTQKESSGDHVNNRDETDTSRPSATYSHWNGFDLDIAPSVSVANDIRMTDETVGVHGDDARQGRDGTGSVATGETNHWDVTYFC